MAIVCLFCGVSRQKNQFLYTFYTCLSESKQHGPGKRNLENDQELTVRTNITHVLNLANDVSLS